MIYFHAFWVSGMIALIGQLIYDNTKLTPGHITSLFVTVGVILDTFGLYDQLIVFAGAGASLPITSFGHALAHGSRVAMEQYGLLGIAAGLFDLTSAGITSTILIAFFVAIIFKPHS